MIQNSYDLLVFISQNKGQLTLLPNISAELGITTDALEEYLDELESNGYIKRYTRSVGITQKGTGFLND